MRTLLVILLAFACGSSPKPTVVDRPVEQQPPYAVALVYCGWEMWIGNDKEVPEIAEDDPSRTPGVLVELRQTLEKSRFPKAPPDALGMLVSYADKPIVRVPMGPIARLDAKALGTQQDYARTTGHALVAAIRLAHGELRKTKARKRAIVILGDGNATNDTTARPALRELREQVEADGIEVFSFIYRARLSSQADVTAELTTNVQTVITVEAMVSELEHVIEDLGGGPPKPDPSVSVPYAVALVYNGWEVWIGNDKEVPEIKPGAPDMYPGALLEMRAAFAKASFPTSAPPDARGMIITYIDKPIVRLPMGPIAKLDANALGTQWDYFKTTGVDLVRGVHLAIGELKKVNARKRYLIVLGDGNDTNNEAAVGQLLSMQEKLKKDNVEVFALVYKSKLSGDGDVTKHLTPNVQTFTSSSAFGDALAKTLQQLGK